MDTDVDLPQSVVVGEWRGGGKEMNRHLPGG